MVMLIECSMPFFVNFFLVGDDERLSVASQCFQSIESSPTAFLNLSSLFLLAMTAALPSLTPSATSLDYTIMALRRPPTRVELKADDIEEYNEVSACACSIVD
jgi:hypothetical protein